MKFTELFTEVGLKKIKDTIGEDKFEEFANSFSEKEDILQLIPYTRFKEVNDTKKALESELLKANEALETIKKENKLTDEEKQFYENQIKDWENKFNSFKMETMITKELEKSGAKYLDLLMSKIDVSKIVEKDGQVEGLEEQIKGLKENYSLLFESEDNNSGNDGIYNNGKPNGFDFKSFAKELYK